MVGFKEHKPPTPLSIFVRGLDPTLGTSISNFLLNRSSHEMEPRRDGPTPEGVPFT